MKATHCIDTLALAFSLFGSGFGLIFSDSLLVLLEVRVVRLVPIESVRQVLPGSSRGDHAYHLLQYLKTRHSDKF
jgi:hypothetical protein